MYLTNVGTPYLQHIECNVFDNILKHLFGEWDTMEMCKDMEEVGMKQHFNNMFGVNIM
jgi:hypothetical protein